MLGQDIVLPVVQVVFERDGGPITAQRVENFKRNNLFVQNGISISKAGLHRLNRQISDAKKLMGITKACTIPIVIASRWRNIASFNPRTNVLFIDPTWDGRNIPRKMRVRFTRLDHPLSTLVHELFHWQDAFEYRQNVGDIDSEEAVAAYTIYQREASYKKLKKAGFNFKDMHRTKVELGEYAYKAHYDSNYEELYTEFRTKQLLGVKSKMRIIFPKDVDDAIDTCAPYLIFDEDAKMMVLKEDTPQEIRELHKKTHERIQELVEEWRRENW